MDPQPPSTPSPDLLGDLLGPLAIEGASGNGPQSEPRVASGLEGGENVDALAIAPVEEHTNTVQVYFLLLLACAYPSYSSIFMSMCFWS